MSLDRVDVRDFLESLGVEIDSASGDNFNFLCPFHRERHPSASMNFKTTQWLCRVGCGKGNAIHFLAKLRGMDNAEARDHIYARYGIGPGAPIDDLESEVRRNLARGAEPIREPRVAPDESWVDCFSIDWEDRSHPAVSYMLGRGFSVDGLRRWQIGYDPLSERVTIPVRDVYGQLVGFKGRSISDDAWPRYKIIGDPAKLWRYNFHTYSKSEHVFGLDRCVGDPIWQGCCYVVEGELNAIAMCERFNLHAIAVAGSEFSDRQRELIASRVGVVIIYFDQDLAGGRGVVKVASALMPFLASVSVVLNPPDDAAAISEDDFHALRSERALDLAVAGDLQIVAST